MKYLEKYINEQTFESIKKLYNAQMLEMIKTERRNIEQVINLFLDYGFKDINKIFLYHFNIFVLSSYYVEDKLHDFEKMLGENWIIMIEQNHNLLEIIK